MKHRPPLVPRVLLRLLVPAERLEEIEGDLIELYHARGAELGQRSAHVRYWLDTASVLGRRGRLFRAEPYALSTPFSREAPMLSILRATLNELRFASRGLARRPAYAALSAGTLALGLGATVAIFTVLNTVLLRPLPYPDSDRIVEIFHFAPGLNFSDVRSSPGLTARYAQHARTVTPVAGYVIRQTNLAGAGDAERVRVVAVTPELFDVLATRPALGRPFLASDTQRNTQPVTILTDAVWRSRFAADPSVVGRTVLLDGQSAQVVGVMPPGFAFPDPETRLLVPLAIDPDAFGAFGTTTIGRLAPGATVDSVRVEIAQLQQRLSEWFPGLTPELLADFKWSSGVQPWRDRIVAPVAGTLWILFATVGLVLVIAASNVANLFLVRAEARQREVAVKGALGAGRGRIALSFFAESLVLAAVGGVLGLMLAEAGTRLLVTYGPPRLPRIQEIRVDAIVVLFTAGLATLAAAMLAILPTLGAARRSIISVIRDGGRGSTIGRGRHRARQLLIVTQVAVALVLMVSAGLLVKSVTRLSAVDPGFRTDGILTAGVSLGARSERRATIRRYQQILSELATVPGVSAVGAAGVLPVAATSLTGSGFSIRSRPAGDNDPTLFTMHTAVTAGYFEALGVPLVAGRLPESSDSDRDLSVAWVNDAFARQFLSTRVIGDAIKLQDDWIEIVGVVGDLRTSGLREDVRPMVYLPLSNPTAGLDVMYAVIRTSGNPAALSSLLRAAVDRVDRSVPLTLRTADDIVGASLAQTTFTVTLVAIAASLGLLLGLVGLYGAISYIAAQRTVEIGVRLALGAKPGGVCLMVLRQGLAVTFGGIVIGVGAAWATARFMSSLLFDVSAHDPATYATVAALLLAVSLVATYVPARKAAGIDPVTALRSDG